MECREAARVRVAALKRQALEKRLLAFEQEALENAYCSRSTSGASRTSSACSRRAAERPEASESRGGDVHQRAARGGSQRAPMPSFSDCASDPETLNNEIENAMDRFDDDLYAMRWPSARGRGDLYLQHCAELELILRGGTSSEARVWGSAHVAPRKRANMRPRWKLAIRPSHRDPSRLRSRRHTMSWRQSAESGTCTRRTPALCFGAITDGTITAASLSRRGDGQRGGRSARH